MSTENDFNIDDPAYWDAISSLAKVLATYSVRSAYEMLEEDHGEQFVSDLLHTLQEAHPEFYAGLAKLTHGHVYND